VRSYLFFHGEVPSNLALGCTSEREPWMLQAWLLFFSEPILKVAQKLLTYPLDENKCFRTDRDNHVELQGQAVPGKVGSCWRNKNLPETFDLQRVKKKVYYKLFRCSTKVTTVFILVQLLMEKM
jgi:hypothetical protein